MKIPKRIWLQVDPEDEGEAIYDEGITWCTWCVDKINDTDVAYICSTIVDKLAQELRMAMFSIDRTNLGEDGYRDAESALANYEDVR